MRRTAVPSPVCVGGSSSMPEACSARSSPSIRASRRNLGAASTTSIRRSVRTCQAALLTSIARWDVDQDLCVLKAAVGDLACLAGRHRYDVARFGDDRLAAEPEGY